MSGDRSTDRPLVSVVVPVYNEVPVLDAFFERTDRVLSDLEGMDHEILFVDDGSTDGSFAKLGELAEEDAAVRVLRLSRNFGHQIAITAGVDHARGDAVVIIDADLQDPPELIPELVREWRDGYDVVYAARESRDGERADKLLTARLFYRVLNVFTDFEIPAEVGDYRLLGPRALEQFRQLREKDRFVRGLVSWIGLRQKAVPYSRDPRHAGETKYPYRKMIKFALDGITSFSSVPLKLATWLGYVAALLAVGYLLSVFVQKALGHTVQGWATIMVAVLFLGSVQLICIGIVGEYVGRIFKEIKPRPMYVVDGEGSSPASRRDGRRTTRGRSAAGLDPVVPSAAGEEEVGRQGVS